MVQEVSAWDIIGFSDEVYDKPPWDFCTDSTAVLDDEKHYFFTLLKRGKNHVLRSIGSYGTWHESSTKKIYDSGSGSGKTIIGFNKLLNFRVKGDGKKMKTTNWLMHEFSVAEKGSNLVLCVIYKKNKKKEEGGLALALARPPSVVVDSGILGSPKSVFYQVDFFDGIDDTDMGSQDPIVDSNILGSPKSVFDRVDFFDDMGMGGQDSYDDQDRFDESPRFAAIDGHSQFQAQKRKLGLLEDDDSSKLATCASPGELNVKDISTGVGKNRDNLDRAFYKELVKVIEASDVILEVLDARDPVDLVPREAVEKWLKYLREELPVVAFKCSTQEQRSNLGWKSSSKAAKPSNLLQTSDFLGAETLIKLLKNYSRSHDIKKSITVGVIGLPNVGKSSLINSLKRSHVVTCQCWFYSWLNKIYARGKIPYYTMPPIRNQGEPSEAKIVSELGKEFNIYEVYDTKSSFIRSLRSVVDLNPVEVPPSCPLNFDEDLLEMKKAEEKRRKRAEKSIPEDAIDDEYDFKVNYVKKRSAMDVGDEDDGNQIIGKVPICLIHKKMRSEVEGLDQEKKGMECLPLPLSLVDFVDAHHLFDENLSLAAPGDQEDIAEKMAYEVVDGFDEAEVEGLLLDLADDIEPNFDPLSFLDLLDSEEGARLSKKMRSLTLSASPLIAAAASSSSSSSSSPNNLLLSELNNSWTFAQMWIDFFM
nr:guanine nucleotide-binding protein-like nsn1 [Quercus suber]